MYTKCKVLWSCCFFYKTENKPGRKTCVVTECIFGKFNWCKSYWNTTQYHRNYFSLQVQPGLTIWIKYSVLYLQFLPKQITIESDSRWYHWREPKYHQWFAYHSLRDAIVNNIVPTKYINHMNRFFKIHTTSVKKKVAEQFSCYSVNPSV